MKSLIVFCILAIGASAVATLAAIAAGQLALWLMGDLVRVWTSKPMVLATIAIDSMPAGVILLLIPPSSDPSAAALLD